MSTDHNVAVVGATSAQGSELVKILEERNFPVRELRLAGPRQASGHRVEFRGEDIPVRILAGDIFEGIELTFFMADDKATREYVPQAIRQGSKVIDSSGVFSRDGTVPLVVPEINAHTISPNASIIASPNSISIPLATVLNPLHRSFKITRVIVSTYQAVSSSGPMAVDELSDQIKALFNFREPQIRVYPHQIAFNCLPHVDEFEADGYTREESLIALETQRLLGDESIRLSATCVCVPVFYSHSQAVHVETVRSISVDEARDILGHTAGIAVEDDPPHNTYPLPLYATGKDDIFVGRIRQDKTTPKGLAFWIAADNLRKGAALNAVQIAETLLSHA